MTDYVGCGDGVATISVNFGHFSPPSTMMWFGFSFHLLVSAVDLRAYVMVLVAAAVVVVALNYEDLSELNERYQYGPHEMMTDLHWYAQCPSVLTELQKIHKEN